jgi:NAD(P)H-dependent FMN reductase
MIHVAIIIGSTRPGRKGEAVASWVHDLALNRGDAGFEVVDLTNFALPPLGERMPAIMGQYTQPPERLWRLERVDNRSC